VLIKALMLFMRSRIRVALDEKQRYTIPEAIEYLRTSRVSIYKLISTGELRVIKMGKRTYVPGSEIVRHSSLPSDAP
jgi:excisionase family DNA binding protein